MMYGGDVKVSLLDFAPSLGNHERAGESVNRTQLIIAAEAAGYHRYWMSHPNPSVTLSSEPCLSTLSQMVSHTRRIRIGLGGMIRPNGVPSVSVKPLSALASRYPGRIDSGLLLATDFACLRGGGDLSKAHEAESLNMMKTLAPTLLQLCYAQNSEGVDILPWFLVTTVLGAQLAARNGLPLLITTHMIADAMITLINLYRAEFRPSSYLDSPYIMVCVNVVAAETQKRADWLATTELQYYLSLSRGSDNRLSQPVHNMDVLWQPVEAQHVLTQLKESIWGSPKLVRSGLQNLIRRTSANEILVNSYIYYPEARIRSYQIIADCLSS